MIQTTMKQSYSAIINLSITNTVLTKYPMKGASIVPILPMHLLRPLPVLLMLVGNNSLTYSMIMANDDVTQNLPTTLNIMRNMC